MKIFNKSVSESVMTIPPFLTLCFKIHMIYIVIKVYSDLKLSYHQNKCAFLLDMEKKSEILSFIYFLYFDKYLSKERKLSHS